MAQGWSWPKIKARLEEAGTPLAKLARDHGYHRASFSNMKTDISAPIQQIIAGALGVNPKTIWPSRYHHNGRPRPGQRRRPIKSKSKLTSSDGAESRLKREAANTKRR